MTFARQLLVGSGFTLALLLSSVASGQTMDKKVLTLDGAKKLAAAAESEAKKNNWNVVIAIVDDGGNLLYLQRMDNAQVGSVKVAIEKARSANNFKRPSKAFADDLASGRQGVLALHGAVPLDGGLPLAVGGQIVGAIGVSGVLGNQDAQIAKAGVDALGK